MLPHIGWINVNTNGAALGAPGLAGRGGFFAGVRVLLRVVLLFL